MGINPRYKILLFVIISLLGNQLHAQTFAIREYKVALILPFKSSGYHGSLGEAMLDYYEGFRMASEELEDDGLHLKLYVFDSEKDSFALTNIFKHPDMKNMDIVVGPVYENQMKETEEFCVKNSCLLISPLKFCKPTNKKSEMVNFFTPDSVRIASIAEKAATLYPNYKFYLATDNSAKSKLYLAQMKRALLKQKVKTVKSLTYLGSPISASSLVKDSVVILSTIASTNAKDALAKSIANKKHAILIAHADWHNPSQSTFEINEPQILYPEMNYTSPSDSSAARFRRVFLEKTYAEPSKYAYIGYDQAMYLNYGLMTFGKDFIHHLPNADYRGSINVIHLVEGPYGIMNTGMNYLQIIDEERREYRP